MGERRRTEAEARRCSQDGCPGDGRYQPPGRGHLFNCQHEAVSWVWGTITAPEASPVPGAVPGLAATSEEHEKAAAIAQSLSTHGLAILSGGCRCGWQFPPLPADAGTAHRRHQAQEIVRSLAALPETLTQTAAPEAVECGAQYGHNPELCYHEKGHPGAHSNRYGTTWGQP